MRNAREVIKIKVVFDVGETRHVKLKICNIKGEPFEITSADYEFTKQCNSEIIESGHATIIDHVLDVVLSHPERGNYWLKYTYIIGDETLVDNVEVTVL